jgi:hypothetical protein
LEENGETRIHGYGKYHDQWRVEDNIWRLGAREVHLFGLKLGAANQED